MFSVWQDVEDVIWLHVAMDYLVKRQEIKGLQYMVENEPSNLRNFLRGNAHSLLISR